VGLEDLVLRMANSIKKTVKRLATAKAAKPASGDASSPGKLKGKAVAAKATRKARSLR